MIINGREWLTAAEIERRWPDVTIDRLCDWARRGLVTSVNIPGSGRGTTWWPLDEAAAAERMTRTSTRGRKRTMALDLRVCSG